MSSSQAGRKRSSNKKSKSKASTRGMKSSNGKNSDTTTATANKNKSNSNSNSNLWNNNELENQLTINLISFETGDLPRMYYGDPELSIASKRLLKKDYITKTKAFDQISHILKDRGKEILEGFLPYFIYVYIKLCIDNTLIIRKLLNSMLLDLVIMNKHAFGPYMEYLIGPWWLCTSDPVDEVSHLAQEAFDKAIPLKKRTMVLERLSPAILTLMKTCLQARPETLSDLKICSIEEADDRYERVVLSSIRGVGRLIDDLPIESNLKLLNHDHHGDAKDKDDCISVDNHGNRDNTGNEEDKSVSSINQDGQTEGDDDCKSICMESETSATTTNSASNTNARPLLSGLRYCDVMKEEIWKKSRSKKSGIRLATYRVLDSVSQSFPQALRVCDRSRLAHIVCNILSEKNRENLDPMLSCFLQFCNTFKEWYREVNIGSAVLIPLRELLLQSPDIVLGYVFPLVGCIPAHLTIIGGHVAPLLTTLVTDIAFAAETSKFPKVLLPLAYSTVVETAVLLLLRKSDAAKDSDMNVVNVDTDLNTENENNIDASGGVKINVDATRQTDDISNISKEVDNKDDMHDTHDDTPEESRIKLLLLIRECMVAWMLNSNNNNTSSIKNSNSSNDNNSNIASSSTSSGTSSRMCGGTINHFDTDNSAQGMIFAGSQLHRATFKENTLTMSEWHEELWIPIAVMLRKKLATLVHEHLVSVHMTTVTSSNDEVSSSSVNNDSSASISLYSLLSFIDMMAGWLDRVLKVGSNIDGENSCSGAILLLKLLLCSNDSASGSSDVNCDDPFFKNQHYLNLLIGQALFCSRAFTHYSSISTSALSYQSDIKSVAYVTTTAITKAFTIAKITTANDNEEDEYAIDRGMIEQSLVGALVATFIQAVPWTELTTDSMMSSLEALFGYIMHCLYNNQMNQTASIDGSTGSNNNNNPNNNNNTMNKLPCNVMSDICDILRTLLPLYKTTLTTTTTIDIDSGNSSGGIDGSTFPMTCGWLLGIITQCLFTNSQLQEFNSPVYEKAVEWSRVVADTACKPSEKVQTELLTTTLEQFYPEVHQEVSRSADSNNTTPENVATSIRWLLSSAIHGQPSDTSNSEISMRMQVNAIQNKLYLACLNLANSTYGATYSASEHLQLCIHRVFFQDSLTSRSDKNKRKNFAPLQGTTTSRSDTTTSSKPINSWQSVSNYLLPRLEPLVVRSMLLSIAHRLRSLVWLSATTSTDLDNNGTIEPCEWCKYALSLLSVASDYQRRDKTTNSTNFNFVKEITNAMGLGDSLHAILWIKICRLSSMMTDSLSSVQLHNINNKNKPSVSISALISMCMKEVINRITPTALKIVECYHIEEDTLSDLSYECYCLHHLMQCVLEMHKQCSGDVLDGVPDTSLVLMNMIDNSLSPIDGSTNDGRGSWITPMLIGSCADLLVSACKIDSLACQSHSHRYIHTATESKYMIHQCIHAYLRYNSTESLLPSSEQLTALVSALGSSSSLSSSISTASISASITDTCTLAQWLTMTQIMSNLSVIMNYVEINHHMQAQTISSSPQSITSHQSSSSTSLSADAGLVYEGSKSVNEHNFASLPGQVSYSEGISGDAASMLQLHHPMNQQILHQGTLVWRISCISTSVPLPPPPTTTTSGSTKADPDEDIEVKMLSVLLETGSIAKVHNDGSAPTPYYTVQLTGDSWGGTKASSGRWGNGEDTLPIGAREVQTQDKRLLICAPSLLLQEVSTTSSATASGSKSIHSSPSRAPSQSPIDTSRKVTEWGSSSGNLMLQLSMANSEKNADSFGIKAAIIYLKLKAASYNTTITTTAATTTIEATTHTTTQAVATNGNVFMRNAFLELAQGLEDLQYMVDHQIQGSGVEVSTEVEEKFSKCPNIECLYPFLQADDMPLLWSTGLPNKLVTWILIVTSWPCFLHEIELQAFLRGLASKMLLSWSDYFRDSVHKSSGYKKDPKPSLSLPTLQIGLLLLFRLLTSQKLREDDNQTQGFCQSDAMLWIKSDQLLFTVNTIANFMTTILKLYHDLKETHLFSLYCSGYNECSGLARCLELISWTSSELCSRIQWDSDTQLCLKCIKCMDMACGMMKKYAKSQTEKTQIYRLMRRWRAAELCCGAAAFSSLRMQKNINDFYLHSNFSTTTSDNTGASSQNKGRNQRLLAAAAVNRRENEKLNKEMHQGEWRKAIMLLAAHSLCFCLDGNADDDTDTDANGSSYDYGGSDIDSDENRYGMSWEDRDSFHLTALAACRVVQTLTFKDGPTLSNIMPISEKDKEGGKASNTNARSVDEASRIMMAILRNEDISHEESSNDVNSKHGLEEHQLHQLSGALLAIVRRPRPRSYKVPSQDPVLAVNVNSHNSSQDQFREVYLLIRICATKMLMSMRVAQSKANAINSSNKGNNVYANMHSYMTASRDKWCSIREEENTLLPSGDEDVDSNNDSDEDGDDDNDDVKEILSLKRHRREKINQELDRRSCEMIMGEDILLPLETLCGHVASPYQYLHPSITIDEITSKDSDDAKGSKESNYQADNTTEMDTLGCLLTWFMCVSTIDDSHDRYGERSEDVDVSNVSNGNNGNNNNGWLARSRSANHIYSSGLFAHMMSQCVSNLDLSKFTKLSHNANYHSNSNTHATRGPKRYMQRAYQRLYSLLGSLPREVCLDELASFSALDANCDVSRFSSLFNTAARGQLATATLESLFMKQNPSSSSSNSNSNSSIDGSSSNNSNSSSKMKRYGDNMDDHGLGSDRWNNYSLMMYEVYEESLLRLNALIVYTTVCAFPMLTRQWWSTDCKSKEMQQALQRFVEQKVSSALASREMSIINQYTKRESSKNDALRFTSSSISREFTAYYEQDETTVKLTVKLPASYPLRKVEVECDSNISGRDQEKRVWMRHVSHAMSGRCSEPCVLDAILTWTRNIDKIMEGTEPCPICYCIVHPKSMRLPHLPCQNCNYLFHETCINEWFKTSNKNTCVLCQVPFKKSSLKKNLRRGTTEEVEG